MDLPGNNSLGNGYDPAGFQIYSSPIDLDPESPHPNEMYPRAPRQQPMHRAIGPRYAWPIWPNRQSPQPSTFGHTTHHSSVIIPPPPPRPPSPPPPPQEDTLHPWATTPTPASSRKKKKGTKGTGTSSRGPAYTIAEDKLLCSAFLNVSRDATVGTNQTSETYWERITRYFNENKKSGVTRTSDLLCTRWNNISKETARFCSAKAEIDRNRKSGKSEQDMLDDALQLYEGKYFKRFQFLHCWEALRNTRKWQDFIQDKVDDTERSEAAALGSQGGGPHTEPVELPRPIGRDSAKRRRSEGGPRSESSQCLELFQQMAKNRELKNQQEAAWAAQNKAMQERQLALQEEQTQIQREQWDFTRVLEENKIMLMDLNSNSLDEIAREYFMHLRQDILERKRRERSTKQA